MTPDEIYNHPSARYVTELVGSPRIDVLRGTIGGGKFRMSGGDFFIPLPGAADVDHPVDLAVRQEDVALGLEGEGRPADIVGVEALGGSVADNVKTVALIEAGYRTLAEGRAVELSEIPV